MPARLLPSRLAAASSRAMICVSNRTGMGLVSAMITLIYETGREATLCSIGEGDSIQNPENRSDANRANFHELKTGIFH